ncbi:MAG: transposase [Gammaproteobacteria bacterium]|nr:transposase [Candidatus Dadabacteria bacterium]NIT41180.1 transposase [Gammaproteobacteria bacterium]
MKKIAYLAMDVHTRSCTLGHMDDDGTFNGTFNFATSENNIIDALKSVKAQNKLLTIEEGTLTHWVAQVASPYVTKVIACDPRENALIFKSPNKKDPVDTRNLCRLLRLGELKHVYHPQDDDRAIFKAAAQHYLDLRDQLIRLKHKIKAIYRHWGIVNVFTSSVYSSAGRDKYLKQLKHRTIRNQLNRLYHLMDQTEAMRQSASDTMKQLGRKYPEIREFKKMPGIANINAHVFDAFIQTPHRFAKRNQLWKYCRLSITDRSSDGKPLGFKRLDSSGVGELKALSFRAFMAAMKGDNEVRRFFLNSLKRTHSRKHARLNTQRKILAVMYSIWKKGEAYRPELFSGSA